MRRFLALSALGLLWSLAAADPSCNDTHHFACDDIALPCIPVEWQCDNHHDCPNGHDEEHCAYLHSCPEGQLMCKDGECVSSDFKCDGHADCSDGTDEVGCDDMRALHSIFRASSGPSFAAFRGFEEPPPRPKCSGSEFTCRHGQCIVGSAHCDGVEDCPLGDDEEDCPHRRISASHHFAEIEPEICPEHHRRCRDGNSCIPVSWICDGTPDCDDESDEAHCADAEMDIGDIHGLLQERLHSISFDAASNETAEDDGIPSMHEFMHGTRDVLCAADEFKCPEGKCIAHSLVCDGKNECSGGEDEGGRCGECERGSHGCSHTCANSPSGPQCSCPKGRRMGADGKNCETVDECAHEGQRCSQHCSNRHHGYECTCERGYALSSDHHTCHLDGSTDLEGLVYVSLTSEIRSMPIFSPQHSRSGYESLVSTNSQGTAKSIDIDVGKGRLFMGLHRSGHSGDLAILKNSVLHKLRENVTGINYVAVDWMGGNVLYTARYPNPAPGIYICNQNGIFCRILVEGSSDPSHKQNYRGLAVNPVKGTVAWVDVTSTENSIKTAKLDGSDKRTVVDHKVDYPTALAFDPIKNDLYFADVERTLIEKINMDTLHKTVVLSAGVHHPSDMAFFNGFLYWTDWGSETLKVASLGYAHSSPHLVHSFNFFPYSIALNHSMMQVSPHSSVCDRVSCPWICVSVDVSFPGEAPSMEPRCICPDEYEESEDFDPSLPSSLACRPRKKEGDEEPSPLSSSFVSVEVMQEYCAAGTACLNGGSCVEDKNEHGRVHRIECSCAEGFIGVSCEIDELANPASLSTDNDDEGVERKSDSNWGWLLVGLVLVAAIAGGLYYCSRNQDEVIEMTRSTMHKVQEARLPERAASALRAAATRNSPELKKEASFCSLSTSASAPSLTTAFSNPAFDIHNSTAHPYSGLEEMNTSDPSFFTMERHLEGDDPLRRVP